MALKIEDVQKNKEEAIDKINTYLNNCILSDSAHIKKANLISFWLKNYTDYMKQEKDFNSCLLKQYSYGDVIKANLGFNIGNEEGGLHYCVVIDKKNAKAHSTLTVVPLTSQKPNKPINSNTVPLGAELYKSILKKAIDMQTSLKSLDGNKLSQIQTNLADFFVRKNYDKPVSEEDFNYFISTAEKVQKLEKIIEEAEQMKKGTIALVNQITTISKQRIYNPKKDDDVLAGISLSDNAMKLINDKLKRFFIK